MVEFEFLEDSLAFICRSSGKAYALLMDHAQDRSISLYPVYNRNVASFFIFVKFARLFGPLVSLDSSREELNRLVDLFFDLWRHVTNLLKGVDSKSIQLVCDERSNSLDGL